MSDNEELTCLRRENEYLKNEVVKLSRYKLRHILCGMRDRCYRKSHFAYKYYGGRGMGSVMNGWEKEGSSIFMIGLLRMDGTHF